MTVKQLAEKLNAEIHVEADVNREVSAFYAGDFLSNAMSKAPENCAWLTVMNNVNVAGVAVLCDVSVIVLCEGVAPDLTLEARADERGINIISTSLSVFEACRRC